MLVAAAAPASAAPVTAAHKISPAWFAARDDGYGATLAAAEQNAKATINGDYGPCKNFYYYDSGQLANGTWYTWVSAECSYYH
jgi:hypothetical protein